MLEPETLPMHRSIERLVDLLDPALNRLHNVDVDEARRRVLAGDPLAVRAIDGSFAIVARDGITVRMARSLDRPMRYFLAKRQDGPALFVADRIDALHAALAAEGLEGQFHPSYTRMVPAHHILDVRLVGCPDPDPTYTRFFTPLRGVLPADLDEIGRRYVGAALLEIEKWLNHIDRVSAAAAPRDTASNVRSGVAEGAPVGVCFSGGVDSGSVFLLTYHAMLARGLSLSRLKAFVLNAGGPDAGQAHAFLDTLGLSLFLEEIDADLSQLDRDETLRVIEDYKPLDVECATMGLRLCRGIRERYPAWRHLVDGDGGDENLKDYPIEENAELTIRSVVDNLMLYQEGWGVGKIKHSLTYSGGLSRSYVRTYAPARRFGFEGFSPYTQPAVLEVAEGIPFAELTGYDVQSLYALKGEIVRRGIAAVTGFDMPVFPKRRFQHGAVPADALRARVTPGEAANRRDFHALYAG